MGNIYIETDENFRVTKIHRMPFDPNNGMGYTREELERKGFFVDEVPSPQNYVGKRSVAMYNPDTKSIYYEYVTIPMSNKDRIKALENALDSLSFIARNALYGLNPTPMTINEESKEEPQLKDMEAIGKYLASRIISGGLDATEVIKRYPELENIIKDSLMENGIQI